MYGAILGDMIGAPYEFGGEMKSKDFPLFGEGSRFTDDTVMTVAVAEALLDALGAEDEAIASAVAMSMQRWGRRYPNAGYGGRFRRWLAAEEPAPYGTLRQLRQWFGDARVGGRLALRQFGGNAASGAAVGGGDAQPSRRCERCRSGGQRHLLSATG